MKLVKSVVSPSDLKTKLTPVEAFTKIRSRELNINDSLESLFNFLKYYSLNAVNISKGVATPKTMLQICYAIILSFCVAASFMWALIGKAKGNYRKQPATIVIADFFVMLNNSGMAISALLVSSTVGRKKVISLLETIDNTDKGLDLTRAFNFEAIRKGINLQVVVGHLAVATLTYFDFWVWSSAMDFDDMKYTVTAYPMLYCTVLTVIEVVSIVLALKGRFTLVNEQLVALTPRLQPAGVTGKQSSLAQSIRVLRRAHSALCDGVETANGAFGVQILMFAANVTAVMLHALFSGFLVLSGKKPYPVDSHLASFLGICWTTFFLALAMALCAACQITRDEANKTIHYVHRMLLDIPSSCLTADGTAEPSELEEAREELMLLARQVARRPVQFSACGFFSVDFALVLSIIGAVTTYVVILMQFNV